MQRMQPMKQSARSLEGDRVAEISFRYTVVKQALRHGDFRYVVLNDEAPFIACMDSDHAHAMARFLNQLPVIAPVGSGFAGLKN